MAGMKLRLFVGLLLAAFIQAEAKSCTNTVTFPVKPFKGFRTKSPQFVWQTSAFGIQILATAKAKSKLQHAAHVMAELFDNDNDGCPDDAKAFKLLQRGWVTGGKTLKHVILMYDKDSVTAHMGKDWQLLLEKQGYHAGQQFASWESLPQCTRAKNFTANCYDATQEEITHWIHDWGFVLAYPKYFDNKWYDSGKTSNLTRAMDQARGGRTKKVFKSKSLYPAKAWYTYDDTSCEYYCQATEYLWWGYLSYSGAGAGLIGTKHEKEFKYLKRADLLAKDKLLAQLFQDSENGKVPYRLPFRAVDGSYNGCAKCKVAGLPSYDGSVTTSATTKSSVTTTEATTDFPDDSSEDHFD